MDTLLGAADYHHHHHHHERHFMVQWLQQGTGVTGKLPELQNLTDLRHGWVSTDGGADEADSADDTVKC